VQRSSNGERSVSNDDVRLETHQLDGQTAEAALSFLGVSPVDSNVLTVDVTEVAETLMKGLRWTSVRRIEVQENPDVRYLLDLLRSGERCEDETDSEHDGVLAQTSRDALQPLAAAPSQ